MGRAQGARDPDVVAQAGGVAPKCQGRINLTVNGNADDNAVAAGSIASNQGTRCRLAQAVDATRRFAEPAFRAAGPGKPPHAAKWVGPQGRQSRDIDRRSLVAEATGICTWQEVPAVNKQV